MRIRNKWMILVLFLLIFSGFINANEYTNTSYYVAYDATDNKQYVLVMPSVNKVYTHQAGHIAPTDLKQIDTQFESFPEYNNGQLCFSTLKRSASGDNGAAVMAGKCYDVKFFYTQKDIVVGEGVAFILIYTPSDTVYEGLAGDKESFKVVREGDIVHNENSITGEDYTEFTFDVSEGKAIIDEPVTPDSWSSVEKVISISQMEPGVYSHLTNPVPVRFDANNIHLYFSAMRFKTYAVVPADIYRLKSTDNGQTWSVPERMAQLEGNYQSYPIGYADAKLYMIWHDGINLDIYVSDVTEANASAVTLYAAHASDRSKQPELGTVYKGKGIITWGPADSLDVYPVVGDINDSTTWEKLTWNHTEKFLMATQITHNRAIVLTQANDLYLSGFDGNFTEPYESLAYPNSDDTIGYGGTGLGNAAIDTETNFIYFNGPDTNSIHSLFRVKYRP